MLGRSHPERDAHGQELALGARLRAKIPRIAKADLRTNRCDEYCRLWTKSVDTVAGSSQQQRNVCTAVIANLPQRVTCHSKFHSSIRTTHTCSPLNLEDIAARDVDTTFAEIKIVASQRGDKCSPALVRKETTS